MGVVVVVERKGGTRKEKEPRARMRAKFSARLVLLLAAFFALAMDGFLTSLAGR